MLAHWTAKQITMSTPKSRQYSHRYCIIFGAASQAEQMFTQAVIFILFFRKENDYVGRKKGKRKVQICKGIQGLLHRGNKASINHAGKRYCCLQGPSQPGAGQTDRETVRLRSIGAPDAQGTC